MRTFSPQQFIVRCFFALFLLGSIWPSVARAAEEGYPHRAEFPGVTYISTEDLAAEYENVIIVDVRSKMEFDVVHILKAVHLPVTEANFADSLAGIREKTSAQKIAFYCNGHTCKKSYEAVQQALEAGFQNVYVYDSGIFDWIAAHPEKAILLGETPVAREKIIPDEAFKAKLLPVEEFTKRAYAPNALLIDIREPFQREVVPPLPQIRNIPLDRLIGVLKEGDFKDKELLIFDAVGKQVNWLQYHLEGNGIKNYFFLEKGVSSFEKE